LRKRLFLVLISLCLFTYCEKKPTSSPLPPADFMPLNPGNWWEYVYCDSVEQDSAFIREEIGDTITLFGFKGYLYSSDFLPYYGFIHVKNDTVILADTSNYSQRRILFINKADAGAVWELYSVTEQYEVFAHQGKELFDVELKSGKKYNGCIKVLTKAHFPDGSSEELGEYFFAKDLGMVKFVVRPWIEHPPIPFELYRYNLE
jgi:hypothetical protein